MNALPPTDSSSAKWNYCGSSNRGWENCRFPALDVLIVDEIGKNISGTGMDLKVVNRGVHGQYNPWPDTPRVERIFIRSLSELSYGNGVGIGLADVIRDRVLEKIDVECGPNQCDHFRVARGRPHAAAFSIGPRVPRTALRHSGQIRLRQM